MDIPVIAYISLYDVNGNGCQWLKGGQYTAKIHYGSVYPGQKMEVMRPLSHNRLVEYLFESYEKLDTCDISHYLHKDLDFRSVNLADPCITKEEYIILTDDINERSKKSKEGPEKPVLVHDETEGDYIELHYSSDPVDIMKVQTYAGFITSITITRKENI